MPLVLIVFKSSSFSISLELEQDNIAVNVKTDMINIV